MTMVGTVAHREFFLLVIVGVSIMRMTVMRMSISILGMAVMIVSVSIMRMTVMIVSISIVGVTFMIVSVSLVGMTFAGFDSIFRIAVARIVRTRATHETNGDKEKEG